MCEVKAERNVSKVLSCSDEIANAVVFLNPLQRENKRFHKKYRVGCTSL